MSQKTKNTLSSEKSPKHIKKRNQTPHHSRRLGQFRSSKEDMKLVKQVPETPQTTSKAYSLAFDDREFMTREELRPVRLQLELLKPEMLMQEAGITSTVVLFGGARIPAPGEAPNGKNEIQNKNLNKYSKFYEVARKFAILCSKHSATTDHSEFVICSGGGPGVMEAANKGASEVGAPSIGLNIVLPHEQAPNMYGTPELSFQFHYFAIRKMHFLMRAKAITAFPGGFGTMDELFEALTLVQTGKVRPFPIVLIGREYWQGLADWMEETMLKQGCIDAAERRLFTIVDDAAAAAKIFLRHVRMLKAQALSE